MSLLTASQESVHCIIRQAFHFINDNQVPTFFPLSLTTRPNKLEALSLETLSSLVLEFEGKARANLIGYLPDASFLGKLLVLPANVRLDWKVVARYKH